MNKTNYHTHIKLCKHAEGMPADYIKKAIELKYEEIGISDHGPLLDEWTFRMNKQEYRNIYLPSLDAAIKEYGDKINIYKVL